MNKDNKNIDIIVPIYGLEWILNNILIEEGIKIRFIHELEENNLLKEAGLNPLRYRCVLEINYKYNQNNISEPYPGHIQFLLNEIEGALRIYQGGIIGLAGIISKQKISPYPLILEQYTPNGQEKYKASKEELKNFPSFYKKVKEIYKNKEPAILFFNRSYLKNSIEKVIYYCICLENLFVPLNSRSKKEFIKQGLILKGFSQRDGEFIDILYDFRNAIMHADTKKVKKIGKNTPITKNFYDECEKILRKVLKIYIENPW